MRGKPSIRLGDQLAVKPLLADASFVAGNQHDRPLLWIEGEGHPPNAVGGRKTQLLHVGMTRAAECINSRPTEAGAEGLEQLCLCQQFVLHGPSKPPEFRLKLRVKGDSPLHSQSMLRSTYVVKYIFATGRSRNVRKSAMSRQPVARIERSEMRGSWRGTPPDFAELVIGPRGACHRAALCADPLARTRWLNPGYVLRTDPPSDETSFRHREERSDEAIQLLACRFWIASSLRSSQ